MSQHLLIDADDTLWENNAYFMEVHADFLDQGAAQGFDPVELNRVLREIEALRTQTRGYGSANYALSLVETIESLNGGIDPDFREALLASGRWIFEHAVEVFPGVLETLTELSQRHTLYMVTKGDREEQGSKARRSGLLHLFKDLEILPEKTTEHYRSLVRRHDLDPSRTWMIGNSPRSDINPASKAGFKTVHIPHHSLWEFEHEDLHQQPDLLLRRFKELLQHF